MAVIVLAVEVKDDLERILDHLTAHDAASPQARIKVIVEALGVLAGSPLIGRPTTGGKRELVIGRGTRGYIALYRYDATRDTVFILAIRNQREAGFQR